MIEIDKVTSALHSVEQFTAGQTDALQARNLVNESDQAEMEITATKSYTANKRRAKGIMDFAFFIGGVVAGGFLVRGIFK